MTESRRRLTAPGPSGSCSLVDVRDADNFKSVRLFRGGAWKTRSRRPAGVEPSAIANLMTKDEARKIAAGIAALHRRRFWAANLQGDPQQRLPRSDAGQDRHRSFEFAFYLYSETPALALIATE